MALYKAEKVNPASGCLPMVVQIPVFFSLYKVIFVTIEMRQAPFFGWIHDLSQVDPTNVFNLFGLIPFDPTTISPYLHLGAWPLIMGVTMFLQQKLNPPPPDPVQAKMFQFMPIIFTFMLARFPAGLVIYWSWNNTAVDRAAMADHAPHAAGAAGPGAHLTELTDEQRLLEAGRMLFAAECRFFHARAAAGSVAAAGRAGGRVRRPVECRQVVAAECADRAARAGARLVRAWADAAAEFLRSRRAADAGGHAGLRLRARRRRQ